MRKAVFKNELHYYFCIHNINDAEQARLLNTLFINPLSPSKQYLLNAEIKNIDDIENSIKKILQNENFIADLKTTFLVEDDLELPNELREQVRHNKGKIAIFTGAGLSKLLGLPLWDELAFKAIDFLQSNNLINYDEAEKIKKESISPKQKLSIFHNVLPASLEEHFYSNCFTPNGAVSTRNPYGLLAKLPFPKFTLNLDAEFLNALIIFQGQLNTRQEETHVEKINLKHIYKNFSKDTIIQPSNALYQVHGYYKDLRSHRIVTMTDYLTHYYNDNQDGVKNFLTKVFKEYSIIFIGIGLEEFELLQYLLGSEKKHHALVSTYMNDTNLLKMKKDYFLKFGINAYGYYLDFNGYQRLYDVLNAWVKEIDRELNGSFYEKTGEFDDVEL